MGRWRGGDRRSRPTFPGRKRRPSVADDPGKVFEPFVLARAGENSLELGACQGLARKLKARLRADHRDPSGVVVTVEFDAV